MLLPVITNPKKKRCRTTYSNPSKFLIDLTLDFTPVDTQSINHKPCKAFFRLSTPDRNQILLNKHYDLRLKCLDLCFGLGVGWCDAHHCSNVLTLSRCYLTPD